MERGPLGILVFGFGAGAAIGVVASEAVSRVTGAKAVLLLAILLGEIGLGFQEFLQSNPASQATVILGLAVLGFVSWSSWLDGLYRVTSDMRARARFPNPNKR